MFKCIYSFFLPSWSPNSIMNLQKGALIPVNKITNSHVVRSTNSIKTENGIDFKKWTLTNISQEGTFTKNNLEYKKNNVSIVKQNLCYW